MRFRERYSEPEERPHDDGGSPGAAAGGSLNGYRQSGERLFDAAQDAIDQAMSADSLQFNQSVQQEGGQ